MTLRRDPNEPTDGKKTVGNYMSFPSSYHGGGGNILFADGHLEQRRWKDPRTTPPLVKGRKLAREIHTPRTTVDNPDFIWLSKRGLGWAD